MSGIEKFARLVMKRAKWLLIMYLVVAIVLAPYAVQTTQKMTASEEAFLPKNIESIIANNVIREEFGGDTSNSIIIVVHSKNGESVLNRDVYYVVKKIKDYVLDGWSIGGVKIAKNYTDFFEVSMGLFNGTIALYSGYISFVNLTRYIVWGLPYIFGSYWILNYTYSSNISLADYNASKMMNSSAMYLIKNLETAFEKSKSFGSVEYLEAFILNYVKSFIFTWYSFRGNDTLNFLLPPYTSIEHAVTNIVRLVMDNIISYVGDESFKILLNYTSYLLNYTSWRDFDKFYTLTLQYFKDGVGVDTSDIFEKKFILDILSGSIFLNRTVYMDYYFDILSGGKYPDLFPINTYVFMRESFVSNDSDTMLLLILLKDEVRGWDDSQISPYIRALREYLSGLGLDYLEFYVTGALAFRIDNTVNAEEDVRRIDLITFLVALLLLFLIYRGVPVSVFPLILMGLTVVIARAFLLFLSNMVGLYISDITIALMTTVIIGAGVDYTIFLISRYAEDRRRGKSKEDAIVSVVKHAGKSVLLSGGTVMISFGSLMLSSFKFLQHVGLGIMIGVGITLFVALTLTPSILHVFGDKIFWPSKIVSDKEIKGSEGDFVEGKYEKFLRRLARWTTRHGLAIILLALLVTVPALYIYYSFGTTYDFMKLTREGTPSKTGFQILQSEIGGESFSAPEIVAVFKDVNFTTPNGELNLTLVKLYIKPISDTIERIDGVKCVRSAYKPYGVPITDLYNSSNLLEREISIKTALTQYISRNGTIARFVVCIKPDPYSKEAFRIIDSIRKRLRDIKSSLDTSVIFYVGGISANYRDISLIVNEDFKVLILTVVSGILLLLFIALRSILIPIRLEITILLSIIWAIALSMVFWQFYASLKLIWFIPLFMFTVLNGLGMDYDIFLVTRIEEERFEKGLSDRDAIIESIASTGKIISIAGIIMASAFGSLLLTLSPPTRQIGLTLMLGVLIDAFVVRVILVPAIMVVAGKWNWWPRKVKEK